MADYVFFVEEVLELLNPIVGKTLSEIDRNNVFYKTENNRIIGDVIKNLSLDILLM